MMIIWRKHLGNRFLVVLCLKIVHGNTIKIWNVVRVERDGRQEPHGNAQSVQDPGVVLGANVGIAEERLQVGQNEPILGRNVNSKCVDQRFLVTVDQLVGVVCPHFRSCAGVQQMQNIQYRTRVPHGLQINQLHLIVAFVEHQIVDPGISVAEHLPRLVTVPNRRRHDLVQTTIQPLDGLYRPIQRSVFIAIMQTVQSSPQRRLQRVRIELGSLIRVHDLRDLFLHRVKQHRLNLLHRQRHRMKVGQFPHHRPALPIAEALPAVHHPEPGAPQVLQHDQVALGVRPRVHARRKGQPVAGELLQHRNQGRVRVDFVRERLVRPEQLSPLEARNLALVDQRDEEFFALLGRPRAPFSADQNALDNRHVVIALLASGQTLDAVHGQVGVVLRQLQQLFHAGLLLLGVLLRSLGEPADVSDFLHAFLYYVTLFGVVS
uniref:(northern house mosquito) hypothetical protein n=1 Tax=Culex pipiens TaxID=7175 RepID=A0A8D8GWB4_CULPI